MEYTWSKYTALVAEDDPLNYRYIQLLLEKRSGINIIWAKNGLEAVNFVQSNKDIDIVLLDLQLPELDGIESLQRIKKEHPFLPVIIQTANSWNNEEERCMEEGADAFFNKPLNIDEVLVKMNSCLSTYVANKPEKIKF